MKKKWVRWPAEKQTVCTDGQRQGGRARMQGCFAANVPARVESDASHSEKDYARQPSR